MPSKPVHNVSPEPNPTEVATATGRGMYNAYIAALDQLTADRVRHSRKSQGVAFEQSWVDRMVPWVNDRAQAATDVHDLSGPFDKATYREYLCWFHGATCVRCFPVPVEVVPHKAEITDTFTMEPPAAFHALTEISLSDVGNELLSYAQRFEHNPQWLVGWSWLPPFDE
ncbi:unnamed protein product [Miscanthus lutarioriparius]|uniref:Uncharacterized protein n=1 Tax=Miscanthus lutarioriparius TaxID=422564 RepID=A0A811SAN2_9POAL|nr:unnamed protein product [Miscanthus lutarioriparius]